MYARRSLYVTCGSQAAQIGLARGNRRRENQQITFGFQSRAHHPNERGVHSAQQGGDGNTGSVAIDCM